MSELKILGGDPVRRAPFSRWPQYLPADAARLQQVLESGHWGGFPVPSRYASEFAEKFAELHGARVTLSDNEPGLKVEVSFPQAKDR